MQIGQTLAARLGGLTLAVVLALFAASKLMGPSEAPKSGPGAADKVAGAGAMKAPSPGGATQTAGQKTAEKAPLPTATPAPSSTFATAPNTGKAAPGAAGPSRGATLPQNPDAERVEADVSTRSVAVTSAFTGVEVVVFGSVINTKSESAESGLYDVVVVVEGGHQPLMVRKKSNVAGIWINTSGVRLENIPSYYAIASTRPLTEVADGHVLSQYRIGFEHLHMERPAGLDYTDKEFADFKHALIRLKKKDGVYVARDYSVAFIGQALFRASIALPANVPVGPLTARVHLFRDGEHLSSYTAQLKLEREGVERWMHALAFDHGTIYGILTVIIAVFSGLLASMMFRKAGSH